MIFGWRKELCVLEKTKPRSTIWKMNFKLEIDACIFKIKITVGIFRKSSYLLPLRLSNSYGSLSNSSSFTALCGFMEKKNMSKYYRPGRFKKVLPTLARTCWSQRTKFLEVKRYSARVIVHTELMVDQKDAFQAAL